LVRVAAALVMGEGGFGSGLGRRRDGRTRRRGFGYGLGAEKRGVVRVRRISKVI